MHADSPSREFAIEVVRRLQSAGHTALWAGGCVRDLCMEREPQDYDVATDAPPGAVRDLFGKRRTLAVGESFGVVLVRGPRSAQPVEVATFRTEGPYLDGRRPEHVEFATAEADAQRRDFTINGMFYDPLAARLLDYVGGERDLHDGVIRAIGRPAARMEEDKLRMLRAVRFASTLDFELDPPTGDAIREMAPQILVVSWERIAQELRKMLVNRHRRRAMRLCAQLGLLERVFPELERQLTTADDHEWTHTLNMLEGLESPDFETAMATLLHSLPAEGRTSREPGVVGGVCRRLRLSNLETERIVWLVEHQHALDEAPQLPLSRLKRILSHPGGESLVTLLRARAASEGSPSTSVEFLESFLQRTSAHELNPPDLISGADLIALGQKPSRKFQDWLTRVRDAQLEGDVRTRDEALQLLERLTSEESS